MIDLHRLPDWEARLRAYLESVRSEPFAWGRHDCCHFAAGAVKAMTGIDPMIEFRGHYATERGAWRALRRYGAGTLSGTLDRKFERVRASLAHRGDIVMTGGVLGVCAGGFVFVVGAEAEREGLVRLDRPQWTGAIAWRVPY